MVDDTMGGPTWKGWGSTMGLVAVVPLSTEGTVVNPSNTTIVQVRGVVVVVLLGRGKRISSGRFDGATWGQLPRSFGEGTVAAFDGVPLPSLVVVDRCQRRWKAPASSAWISTSVATGVVAAVVATVLAPGVAGLPGLAIAAATWAGEERNGWEERGFTRVSHGVREGTRGTGWTAVLSFGTGTGTKQGKGTAVDALTVLVWCCGCKTKSLVGMLFVLFVASMAVVSLGAEGAGLNCCFVDCAGLWAGFFWIFTLLIFCVSILSPPFHTSTWY